MTSAMSSVVDLWFFRQILVSRSWCDLPISASRFALSRIRFASRSSHQLFVGDTILPRQSQDLSDTSTVEHVLDLGVLLSSDMSMDAHLTRLVSSCFGVLRQIRCIRRSLPREALLTLVTSFITSKIDNCNIALAGLLQREIDRIQSLLQNAIQHDSQLMRASLTM